MGMARLLVGAGLLAATAAGRAAGGLADEGPRSVLRDAFRAAEAIRDDAVQVPWRATAFGDIAEAQRRVGDAEGAKASDAQADRLRRLKPDDGTFRASRLLEWGRQRLAAGDRDGALRDLGLAVAALTAAPAGATDSPSGDHGRILHLTWVAEAMAAAGDADGARRALRKAAFLGYAGDPHAAAGPGRPPGNPQSLASIAAAMRKAGAEEDARFTLRRARVAADALASDQGRLAALDAILGVQAEWGERDAARETYRHAADLAAAIKDDNERTNAQAWLVTMLARLGDFDEAFRLIDERVHDDHRRGGDLDILLEAVEVGAGDGSLAHRQSIRVRAKVDQDQARAILGRAVPLARSLGAPWPRDARLARIASIRAQFGDFDEALRVVGVSEDRAHPEADANATLASLRAEIAGARLARGDRDGALKDWREAARLARGLSNAAPEPLSRGLWSPAPRFGHLTAIAQEQAKAGEVEEALRTVEPLPPGVMRGGQLRWMAAERLGVGDLVGARRIAAALGPTFARAELLGQIAASEDRRGDREAARRDRRAALALARSFPPPDASPDHPVPALSDPVITHRTPKPEGDDLVRRRDAQVRQLVATLLMEDGDPAAAYAEIEAVRDDRFRARLLSEMVGLQARGGDEAGALARGLRSDDPHVRLAAAQAVANAIVARTPPRPAKGR